MDLQLSDNQKGRYQDEHGHYHYVENNLSPLNSQVYLMQEAIKYGQELKTFTQPSGMPVVSKRRELDESYSSFIKEITYKIGIGRSLKK